MTLLIKYEMKLSFNQMHIPHTIKEDKRTETLNYKMMLQIKKVSFLLPHATASKSNSFNSMLFHSPGF